MLGENLFYFNKIVETCQKNNAKLILIIPPATFGKWPGHEEILAAIEPYKNAYDIKVLDFSEIIMKKEYYYDHHHLNANGVKLFWTEYQTW